MRRRSTTPRGTRTVGLAASLALAACAAPDGVGNAPLASAAPAAASTAWPAAGGVMRRGNSFATMAAQYGPRAGPHAATGASAWVAPAPAPAFVAAGPPPPADPPAPPPAAVANRQPGTPSPAEIVRPEAATPDAQRESPDPALRTEGLALFNTFSCGVCHALGDAGAGGSVGPSLDGNPRLTRDFTIEIITDGRGAMPSFAGQMSAEEIATLADYIVRFARK